MRILSTGYVEYHLPGTVHQDGSGGQHHLLRLPDGRDYGCVGEYRRAPGAEWVYRAIESPFGRNLLWPLSPIGRKQEAALPITAGAALVGKLDAMAWQTSDPRVETPNQTARRKLTEARRRNGFR